MATMSNFSPKYDLSSLTSPAARKLLTEVLPRHFPRLDWEIQAENGPCRSWTVAHVTKCEEPIEDIIGRELDREKRLCMEQFIENYKCPYFNVGWIKDEHILPHAVLLVPHRGGSTDWYDFSIKVPDRMKVIDELLKYTEGILHDAESNPPPPRLPFGVISSCPIISLPDTKQ